MTFRTILAGLALAALLADPSAWAAPAGEQWTAYSKTAVAITGKVTFAPDRITFGNGKSLPLAPAGAVPDFLTVFGKRNATLFRVTAPDDPVLLGATHLCGGDNPQSVTFIAISIPPPGGIRLELRAMDVFSSATPPKGVEDPHYCGNYNFELVQKQGAGAAVSNSSKPASSPGFDPGYAGVWAPSVEACKAGDRTAFRITPKGISGKELECEIKQASADGGGWLVRLSCGSEGTDSTLTLRWRLMPNGRLHEDQKGGKSYDYVRCAENARR